MLARKKWYNYFVAQDNMTGVEDHGRFYDCYNYKTGYSAEA